MNDLSEKSILVIDDDAMNREVMEAFLTLEGYHVKLAHNGKKGIQLAQQSPPNLVILDIRLPDMEGYEVAQSLRGASNTATVPILVITGFDDAEVEAAARQAGANEFLTRPFDSEVFLKLVSQMVA